MKEIQFRKILNDYIFVVKIGDGMHSQVWRAIKPVGNEIYAIKVIPINIASNIVPQIQNEYNIALKLSDHQAIPRLIERFKNESYICTVYEEFYSRNLELIISQSITNFTEIDIKNYIFSIFTSLSFLHSSKVMHRNIQPKHILMGQNGYIKFCGLSQAYSFENNAYPNTIGETNQFTAPEVLENIKKGLHYDEKIDVYSIGCIMYLVLFKTLFNNDFSFKSIDISNLSLQCKQFLKKILSFDPKLRYTSSEALMDPYFNSKELTPSVPEKNYKISVEGTSKYKKVCKLGEGGFSKVFKCNLVSNPNLYFAMKEIKLSQLKHPKLKDLIIGEIDLLEKLSDCKQIIKLHEHFKEEDKLYLILEYINGKDLDIYIQEMNDQKKHMDICEIQQISRDMALALFSMHSQKIVHRDLKPQNVLLQIENGKVVFSKLCDLGLSKSLHNIESGWKSVCGTKQYMAPEIYLMQMDGTIQSDYKCDVWSYGLIVY